ncbi:MAG: CDP-diacylglycerol--serine O-phosphatidyltransferase [Elusimicrobiota bacterium]|jgi:CDP-diacylglycerol--serine O-phosphatidyltransferase|nr:CDP-diacylglycerol--serine O-phosphatidyltransferase [Elusimicrobiota bacterium]
MNKTLKRGIYVIPTLFTCANMAFGFLSMLASIRADFSQAAWFLVLAIVCDVLDGRIARLTKTTSEFGVQIDSLSDLVSFGIAPAVMIYLFALTDKGKLGMAVAVLFVLCAALRLAKFNVIAQDGQVHAHFSGLPTPASAGVLISFVLSYKIFYINSHQGITTFKTIPILVKAMPWIFEIMPFIVVALGLLMVSTLPYFSFKKVSLAKPKTLRFIILLIFIIFLIAVFPQNMFFIIFFGYAISGLLAYFFRVTKISLNKVREKRGEDER